MRWCDGRAYLWRAEVRNKLDLLLTAVTPWPVYAEMWQRDCDQCEGTSAHRFACGLLLLRAVKASYRNAEGPVRWTRLTRREYRAYECTFRDRRAEEMGY